MRLLLASTSPYRKELLDRLRLPFEQIAPSFDEALPGSMPVEELVEHNTLGKARSVWFRHPEAHVIASDQLLVHGKTVLGKPGSIEKACEQLACLSDKQVTFLTGLTLLSPVAEQYACIPFKVRFRKLSEADIKTYIEAEQPIDCAGSFKSEGLGISLFERLEGDDPTALIGMPLIRLSQWLQPLTRISQ